MACLFRPNHRVLFSIPLPNYVEAEITKTAILLSLLNRYEICSSNPLKEHIYGCLGRWLSTLENTRVMQGVK